LPKTTLSVKINLRLLGRRFIETGKTFIKISDLVYELGVSPQTAGKILSALAKLGYVTRWSDSVYKVVARRDLDTFIKFKKYRY